MIKLDDFQQSIVHFFADDEKGPIRLSGGAGSGKSEVIKECQKVLPYHSTVYLAPTGKAALNLAGRGQTIHRYFKLEQHPLPPNYLPNVEPYQLAYMKSLTHLVIDEISMVRADIFNAMEHILRKVKGNDLPWGGVKVMVVGDFSQLAPVLEGGFSEAFYIEQHHGGKFAFQTEAWKNSNFTHFHLTKCYRQNEEKFIHHLNIIRNCQDTKILKRTLKWFNRNIKITSEVEPDVFQICPKRKDVAAINRRMYKALDSDEIQYDAMIKGYFPFQDYPTEKILKLKLHCPVRITKNKYCPKTGEPIHVNGNTGIIIGGNEHVIEVMTDDGRSIQVKNDYWEHCEYNEYAMGGANRLNKTIRGTFTQMPLAVNFAGTIHSAQGASLSRVHLHLDSAFFEAGQLYVALSRARSLAGLTMSRELSIKDIQTNLDVIAFEEAFKAG